MKPPVFDYQDPATIDEVLGLLSVARADASLLAGGQSLMPLLNMRRVRPRVLIDINRVEGLDEVSVTSESVTIGATARLARLARNPEIAAAVPALPRVISFVAHPQIRTRTTIGGSLSYADPAAELPALAVALGATLHLRSSAGSRAVPAEGFFETAFTTGRRPDELLTHVEFPRHPGLTMRYDEIARAGDFPFVGLCLGLRLAGGEVTEARAAAAGAADRPVRLGALERSLIGRSPGAAADDAARAASDEVDPLTDQHATGDYRRGALRALVRRLLSEF
ncbi:MAG TPA: FAD binding domain-containing protein [Trebonia sp.]|nr:FAD binding domain-containing protein [Trebonia sp.]